MRRVLALLLVAAVAGCGSEDEQTVTAPDNAVARAAGKTAEQKSARLTMKGTIDIAGQKGTYTGAGVMRFKPPKVELGMDVTVAGESLHVDEVMDAGVIYTRLPEKARTSITQGKSWVKVDIDEALDSNLSGAMSAGSDPGQYLRLLSATGIVKEVGKERVGGRATTHYAARIDYREVAESGPQELRDLAKQSLKLSAAPVVPVDVWIDAEGLVRQELIRVATKATKAAPAQEQLITIAIPEYGVDASGIDTPPASDTFDATEQARRAVDAAG